MPSPPPITAAVKPIISEGPELPLAELEKRLGEAVPGSPEVILTSCQGCGAQVEVPSTSSLGECLFCDRKVQTGKAMPSTTAGKAVVVPFSVEMPEALERIIADIKPFLRSPCRVGTGDAVLALNFRMAAARLGSFEENSMAMTRDFSTW